MKKKTDKLDRQKLIAHITKFLTYHPPNSDKNKKIAYQGFIEHYPEVITYSVWENLYSENKKPESIVDSIIKTASEKQKIKHIQERLYYNHPGRPRDKEWKLIAKADDILMGKTSHEWQQIGVDLFDYEELKDKMIQAMVFGQLDVAKDITPRWSRHAIDKMLDEIITLKKMRAIFINRLSKAISEPRQNSYFLKRADDSFKRLIGEGLTDILNRNIPINPRGKKINVKTLSDAIKNAREYSQGRYSHPKRNFYERDKLIYLCYLAANIELYFRKPIKRIEREVVKLRVTKAINNLAEYYSIQLDELMPPKSLFSLPATNSLLGSSASSKPAAQKTNPIALDAKKMRKLLDQYLERQDSLNKSLKVELSAILKDLDKR